MNEVIKVKLVDLAAVELREAVTYALEECAKLLAVIRPNQLTAARRDAFSSEPAVLLLGSATS